MSRLRLCLGASTIGLVLTACTTLGPDFVQPTNSWQEGWQSPSFSELKTSPAAEDGAWWKQFGDPALDALIAEAVAKNTDLKAAGLRVLEARALVGLARAQRWPLTAANAAGGYGASAPEGTELHEADFWYANADISSGWEIDFWGKFRRGIEAADAGYFASIANYEDFAIILRAEVANAYFTHRTFEERLRAARENIGYQQRAVDIAGVLFRNGAESELDLQDARTQLLSTQASIPPMEAALVQARNALAVLLDRPPGPVPELKLSPPSLPKIPGTVAGEMPADLLRRRPDVRAAAFFAAAQSADIGIATADLYPSLSLVGSIGATRLSIGGPANVVNFAIGPSLRWNIFDFGRIRNNIRVQDAQFEQALAAYQSTVLRAAAEVDDSAIALKKSLEENVFLDESLAAAVRSLELADLTFQEGLSDFDRVLDAQAALLRQQDRQVSERGAAAINLVAVYKAIGGGWIAATESDFGDEATRARMKARTNWGDLLDPPPAQQPEQPAGVTHE